MFGIFVTFYLVTQILPNKFGQYAFSLIEHELRNMAHSGSEKDCLHHYLKAAEIIRRRCKNNDAKINDHLFFHIDVNSIKGMLELML